MKYTFEKMLELSKLEKLIELQIKILPHIRTAGWLIRPVMYTNYKNINLTTNTILNYRISPIIITSVSVPEIRHKQVAYRRIGIYVFTESTELGVEQSREYIPKSIKCQLLGEYNCFHFLGTMGAQVANIFFIEGQKGASYRVNAMAACHLYYCDQGVSSHYIDWLLNHISLSPKCVRLWRGHKSYSKCVSH